MLCYHSVLSGSQTKKNKLRVKNGWKRVSLTTEKPKNSILISEESEKFGTKLRRWCLTRSNYCVETDPELGNLEEIVVGDVLEDMSASRQTVSEDPSTSGNDVRLPLGWS